VSDDPRPSASTEKTAAAPHRASSPPLPQGAIAGVYEPLLVLADGGMARVYLGRRLGASGFERLVVIKQIHRHHLGKADFRSFFHDEARIASLIHHAHVVSVIDVIDQPDELVLVGEYVESASLSMLFKHGGAIPMPIVLRIAQDVLAGLHAAHELVDENGRRLDVVHRDVSPQNILVGVDGSSRVIDFGIAKAEHRVTETESGHIKGKSGYMAPEQVRGGLVDRRSDIFSLGVVLYEVVSGKRLFVGDSGFEAMQKILVEPIPPLERATPELEAVIRRALEREASARYATATELLDALEKCGHAATTREVANFVESRCGAILKDRRERLAEARRGSPTPISGVSALVSSSGTPSSRSLDTIASVPPSAMTQVATSRDTVSSGRSRGAWAVGVLVILLAIGAVASIAIFRARAGAVVAQQSGPEEVLVEVSADAPIKGISAPGLRRSELDGAHARVYLLPWNGEIAIDAQLADDRTARALVRADGPRIVSLVASPPTATATPVKPVVSASASPPSRPARPPVKAAPPPPRPDLHDNPY
jgi:serine/threonine-protein kinase